MIRVLLSLGLLGIVLFVLGRFWPQVDIAPGSGRPGLFEPAAIGPSLIGAGAGLVLVSAILALYVVPAQVRLRRVVALNPDGPNFIARADASLAHALNRRLNSQPTLARDVPALVVLSVDSTGVSFWGRDKVVPLARFEWSEISKLTAVPIHMGRDTIGIELRSPVAGGPALTATVVPANATLLAYAKPAETSALVHQMIQQGAALR